uniref:KAP P-loop domain protein n=1 Tax=Psychrobacter sp. (strain PRwf-1) TaxID=349106 RepID=A5WBC9_PSYWF
MQNESYSSDAPVSKIDEDAFSRWSFSKRVAQVIANRQDPSSIVIGLYGAWGDGKTSVLNFIDQSLTNNEAVICIRFNPWRFGTEDQLLLGFFNQIADALDNKLTTSSDKLKDIGNKILKPVTKLANVEAVGEIVTSFISMPDIDIFKERTEKLLEESKKRVLILIDDVDRLDKTEIHTLFRLVKLTADFKYTSYILAFDKDIVSSSLQDRYSSSQGNSGEAFLEKIIQVPLNLPYIDKSTLRSFCYQGIDEALQLANIELTQEQIQRFSSNYLSAFESCISTPRKAKLYSNTLMFSLPILKGEVNPIDLMLIEGIRLFYPKLYDFIKNNQDLFAGTFISSQYGNDNANKEYIKKLIDETILNLSATEKEGIVELLKDIFPRLQAVYNNTYHSGDSLKIWEENQNICSKNYFFRYFGYSLLPNDISDTNLNLLVQDINNWQPPYSTETNPLYVALTPENADTLIQKLYKKVASLDSGGSTKMAIAITQISEKLPAENSFMWSDAYTQSTWLIADLILNISKVERVKVIKNLFNHANTIDYQTKIFRFLKHDQRDDAQLNYLSSEEMRDIGTHLARKILAEIQDKDITLDEKNPTSYIFWLLNKYINQDVVNDYIEKIIRTDDNAIYRILDNYTTTFTNLVNGIERKDDLNQNSFNYLSKHINVSIIYQAIERHYPELTRVLKNYPNIEKGENDRETPIIQQFLWWYRRDMTHRSFEFVSSKAGLISVLI